MRILSSCTCVLSSRTCVLISRVRILSSRVRILNSRIPVLSSCVLAFAGVLHQQTTANAQELNFSLKWGKEFEASRRSTLNDIVGHDATGIYAVKLRTGFSRLDYTLEHYNTDFSPSKSFDLDIEAGKEKVKVNSIFYLKGKLYMFYATPDRKTKKNKLSLQEIDKSTLQPKGEIKKIGEIDYAGKKKYNDGNFYYKIARDSSKILIVYSLPYEEDTPQKFGFHVLSNQMNTLWQKDITLPYPDEPFDIINFRVDNEGNAYLLGKVFKEKRKEKRRGLPNYSYEVIACRDAGSSVQQYPISIEDRFLTDMQIEIQDAQTIICAGFYSEKGTISIRGTYFLKVDAATKTIKAKNFKEFDIDFITQHMTVREAKKAARKEKKGQEVELFEYDLDKLLVGKDGSAVLIAEQYFVKSVVMYRMINGRSDSYTVNHYYYNDIIAVKMDPSGEIAWAKKIPKTQHTREDGGFYSSYAFAIVKGNLCFIFNDNPDNLELDDNEKADNYRPSKSIVVVASLDQKGNLTKKPIFNSKDVEVITVPKVCEQISNTEVVLFGQRKKTQQFGRLSFN
jgi:hypothetical protein